MSVINNVVEYNCEFCNFTSKSQKRYYNHKCKIMIRNEEVNTHRGNSAYYLYLTWFKLKDFKTPTKEMYINSSFYNSFLKISDFIKLKKINNVELYIKYMIDKNLPPSLWTNMQIFCEYINFCIKNIPYNEQIDITIKWLDNLAGKNNCDIKIIIDKLTIYDIMNGIRQAKFLPWYFLNSPKFNNKFKTFTKELQKEYLSIIDMVYWKNILLNNLDIRNEVKQLIKLIET